jgi:hypothetical protein
MTHTLLDNIYHAALSEDLMMLHIACTNTDTSNFKLEWYVKYTLQEPSIIRAVYVADGKLHTIVTPISDALTLFVHITDIETSSNGVTYIKLDVGHN